MGLLIGFVSGCRGKDGTNGTNGTNGLTATPPTFTLTDPTCTADVLTGNNVGYADFNITAGPAGTLTCTAWGALNNGYGSCTLFGGYITLLPGATLTDNEIDCYGNETNFSSPPDTITFFVTCSDLNTGLSTTLGATTSACESDD